MMQYSEKKSVAYKFAIAFASDRAAQLIFELSSFVM